MRKLLSLLLLAVSLLIAPIGSTSAEPNGQYNTFFYIEVHGAPDPTMGGNQPLIASGDSATIPSSTEMQAAYGGVAPGGDYTVQMVIQNTETGATEVFFISAGGL